MDQSFGLTGLALPLDSLMVGSKPSYSMSIMISLSLSLFWRIFQWLANLSSKDSISRARANKLT